MDRLDIEIDGEGFAAELRPEVAPESIDAVRSVLPLETTLSHVRWSGYAVWINIDDLELPSVPRENHTVYPSRGDVLFYPGYRNEREILIACGPTCFKSPAGELAGNHIGTIVGRDDDLARVEAETLATGRKPVTITDG